MNKKLGLTLLFTLILQPFTLANSPLELMIQQEQLKQQINGAPRLTPPLNTEISKSEKIKDENKKEAKEKKLTNNFLELSKIEKFYYSKALQFHKVQNNSKNDTNIESNNPTLIKEITTFQYGYDIFRNYGLLDSFDFIPVEDNYILGPNDNLIIRLWGKIETMITETIDKNGNIYIPQVGYIYIAGTSFIKAKTLIKKEIEKKFVNVETSITMGKLKTIKVYILGEIEKPGAYNISSLSTLMNALYIAGGPKKSGSLRNIELRRKGFKNSKIDLYKFILKGNSNQDPVLKTLDTIYIPPIKNTVQITGGVNKEAIFEFKNNENLSNIITHYANGLSSNSAHTIATIQRIKNEKTHIININMKDLKNTPVENGDSINIQKTNLKNIDGISIVGEVNNPGQYEILKNKTLKELILNANGFTENAHHTRIHISRLNNNNIRSSSYIDYSTNELYPLKKGDIISIKNTASYFHDTYTINGAVHYPKKYKYKPNLRLSDVLENAKPHVNAEFSNIEVYRNKGNFSKSLINIDASNIFKNREDKNNILIEKNDVINIRFKKDSLNNIQINISGEVSYPGNYFATEKETLNDIIKRAGGFTNEAFKNGIILKRKSVQNLQSKGLQRIIKNEKKNSIYKKTLDANQNFHENIQNSAIIFLEEESKKSEGRLVFEYKDIHNILIENGDQLIIPKKINTVQVVGGVHQEMGIKFKENKKPKYYIEQTGGINEFAKKNEYFLIKANGIVERNGKNIASGDTLYIPEKIKIRTNPVEKTLSVIEILFKSVSIFALLNTLQ